MREPAPAARFSATPAAVGRPAPLMGEHTDEILRGAGLSDAEISDLRAAGTVRAERTVPHAMMQASRDLTRASRRWHR